MAEVEEKQPEWIRIQQKTFTRWFNTQLKERILKIDNLQTDLSDGTMLIALLEIISSKSLGRYNKTAKIKPQKYENIGIALKFLQSEGIKLVNIGPEDIESGKLKLILGLIWTIILRYQIHIEEGKSARNDLLNWVRQQIPEYDIKNFNKDWNDGRAICALVDSLKNGLCPQHRDLDPEKGLENATLGMDLAQNELQIPEVLDPVDLINPDVDELSMMTYISYFRDYLENLKKRMAADELEKLSVAGKCKAYGPGLEGGYAGHPTDFTIEAINTNGRRVNHGGDPFKVDINGPSGAIESEITDNEDGTYKVVYTPGAVGEHTIAVTLNESQIEKSPFKVKIIRANPNAKNSKAYGPGLEAVTVGEEAPFTIESFDDRGLPVNEGGDKYDVKVTGPQGDVPVNMVDNKDGKYSVDYLPEDVGKHTVTVQLKGEHLPGSPFTAEASLADTAANPNTTVAYGPGLEGGKTSFPSVFTIEVKDAQGNLVPSGDKVQPVGVDIKDAAGKEVACDIVDHKDGTHTATYNPENPGTYKVGVVLRHKKNRAADAHIKDSPFTVEVGTGANADKSTAFGPGVEGGITDQEPAKFTVQTKDNKGNNMTEGGAPVEVKISGPNGEEVPATLKDNGDGTYAGEYNPEEPGHYKVAVNVGPNPIAKSPFDVSVDAAGAADKCEAYGPGLEAGNDDHHPAKFTVKSVDKRGNPVKNGGEPFKVKVTGPNGEDVPATLKDNGDGTYDAEYKPEEAGKYQVDVTLRDEPVAKSPYTVDVAAVGDLSKSEVFGPGIESGNDDQHPAEFKVVLKDKNGEPIKNGGEPVKVKVTGPNGDVPATVKDNGDGTYDAEYKPTDAGKHVVEVTLRDEPLAKSPYHVDIAVVGDLANTEVFGPGLEAGNDDQHDAHFTIVSKDKSGEQIKNGGEAFKVDVHGPNGAVPASLKDNGDGTYAATYTPQNAGDHKIDVTLRGEPVAKSPYHVTIKAGADPSKSIAFGNGVDGKGVDDQNPAEFRVQTKDKDGNNLHYGGEPVNAKVTGPNGEDVPCKVKDNGDGTYDAEYQVPKGEAGDYKVDVNIGDKPIAGSPFNVEVEEGIDDEESEVEDYSFVIQAKNAKGEKLTRGGGAFKVSVKGPEGEPIESESRDLGDGTYLVSYKMATPGEYIVTVRVNGRIMKQFPTGIKSSY